MRMTWRNETRPFGGDNHRFDPNLTVDDFLSTVAGFEGVERMTIEETAERVKALANVVSVITGPSIGDQGPDHIHIVAKHPAPFETIANITKDVRAVDITVATEVPEQSAARFREARHAPAAMFDRDGNPDAQNAGKAKGLAADLGIATPPTLSAIYGGKLGILFASVADAEAFDKANG